MSEHSYWWRWLIVLVLPLLTFISKQDRAVTSPLREALVVPSTLAPPQISPAASPKHDFRRAWRATLESLPTIASLTADGKRDLHHTPSEVINGGAAIGRITEEVKGNPERMKESLEFYEACASAEGIVTALRAVCLRTLWDVSEKLGEKRAGNYSAEIQFIAESLPPTRW